MSGSQPGAKPLREGEVTERLNQFVQYSHGPLNGIDPNYGVEHEEDGENEQHISFDLPVEKPRPSSNAFFDDYLEHGNDLSYLDHEHDHKNIYDGMGEQKRSECSVMASSTN